MSKDQIRTWVVVMFENRSFDNLLGYLGHIDARDGIGDREILLPYPNGVVRVGPTASFTDPIPDPGEAYPSVNVQVYGRYRPQTNAGLPGYLGFPHHQQDPWNAPDHGEQSTMDGFALDFFHNSRWQTGRDLTDTEMQSIERGVYTTERPRTQLPGPADTRYSPGGTATCPPRPSRTGRSFTPGPARAGWITTSPTTTPGTTICPTCSSE